jgi:hypothetical protein
MTDELQGTQIEALPRGKKVGMDIAVYNGMVMPRNFGEIVSYAQMMCKAGPAIPKHFRENPGACVAIIQKAMAWEMDVWGIAEKTYFVNDRLAYEAQLIAAVIKSRAPIKEKVIPYKYSGQDGDLQCSILLHHAETGEEIFYESPKVKDIKTKNSPLWQTDVKQQLGYFAIRALSRRHFPEVIMGVYDRDEIMAMRDVTPQQPVQNFLNDEDGEALQGEVLPPKATERAKEASPTADVGEVPNDVQMPATAQESLPADEIVETVITPELIAGNFIKSIAYIQDQSILEEWQNDNGKDINALPKPLFRDVKKAIDDRFIQLGGL